MPGISSRQDWKEWAQGGKHVLAGESPSVQDIPPMLRRRLSPLGKMALSVAWPLLSESAPRPSVFCSRHGELERTVGMLRGLAEREDLSPTHFSLSVHNAIGGVFSIARSDPSPITALAVPDEGLSQAILEARLILAEQQCDEALCVVYDAPLPEVYREFGNEPQWPYAAAFIIGQSDPQTTPENRFSLSLTGEEGQNDSRRPPGEPQVLTLIRFLLDEQQSELRLPAGDDFWQWQRDRG